MRRRMVVMNLAALFLLVANYNSIRASPAMGERLTADLFSNYSNYVFPKDRPLAVHISLSVERMSVDAEKQLLSLSVSVTLQWIDDRLYWVPSEYGNITNLVKPEDLVWIPDIGMISAAEPDLDIIKSSKVHISGDGQVTMSRRRRIFSLCDFTESQDDLHVCKIQYGSLVYGDQDIEVIPGTAQGILQKYTQSGDWDILNATSSNTSNGSAVYTLHIKKVKSSSGTVTGKSNDVSALPLVFLGFVAPFQFLIPLESSQRITVDVLLFLTGTVIAIVVYDIAPAMELPIVVVSYCNFTLTVVFLCLILSIANLQLCTALGKRSAMLEYLKRGLFSGANRLVFVAVPKIRDIRVKRPHVILEHRLEDMSPKEQTTDVDSPPEGARDRKENEKLTEIIDILVPMADEQGYCQYEARFRREWLTVGLILDRLMFIFFLLLFVFCSFGYIR
ncbi:acetylcholine receptor subunit alpha-like [Haliotis rubra]|uniref:acetylcholine receptor subunit alpha-like n=1 Tax=Haliotis rubra TaxID=36100 RepID=UPI001EE57D46|nr:acetylcholine receptor subunit alpha-like [Haliotis rubra]